MNRWQRIDTLFDAALDVPAARRISFLKEECGSDTAMLREVTELLAAYEEPTLFLDNVSHQIEEVAAEALVGIIQAAEPEKEGTQIGPYRIVRLISMGGMGEVYLAERDDSIRRRVALKLLRSDLLGPDAVSQFGEERRIHAALEHPAIARLYDGGMTEDHRPWFAMEFVEGAPITTHCQSRGCTLDQRLDLFLTACQGVQHAHERMVIHLDLKPSNVLVANDGSVKLLDFGIARLLEEETLQSGRGWASPAYASPEQLAGGPVGAAADVFMLGGILEHLLTGRPPGRGGDDLKEAIHRHEPVRVALAEDMVAIVERARAADADHRYPTVGALMRDIRAARRSEPILAWKPPPGRRLTKFRRRHAGGFAAAAGVLTVLLAGLVSTVWQAREASRERDVALRERATAIAIREFLVDMLRSSAPSEALGLDVTAREILNVSHDRVRAGLVGEPEVQAELLRVLAGTYAELGDLNRALAIYAEAAETGRLRGTDTDLSLARLHNDVGLVLASAGRSEEALVRLDSAQLELAGRGPSAAHARAQVMRSRAAVLAALGRNSESAHLIVASLKADPDITASAATNAVGLLLLGRLRRTEGKVDEARRLAEAALAIARDRGMESAPVGIVAMFNLATAEAELGLTDLSEFHFEQAAERAWHTYEAPHRQIAYALARLSIARGARGRIAESERLMRQAVQIANRVLPEDSAERAFIAAARAYQLGMTSAPDKALWARAVATLEGRLGKDNDLVHRARFLAAAAPSPNLLPGAPAAETRTRPSFTVPPVPPRRLLPPPSRETLPFESLLDQDPSLLADLALPSTPPRARYLFADTPIAAMDLVPGIVHYFFRDGTIRTLDRRTRRWSPNRPRQAEWGSIWKDAAWASGAVAFSWKPADARTFLFLDTGRYYRLDPDPSNPFLISRTTPTSDNTLSGQNWPGISTHGLRIAAVFDRPVLSRVFFFLGDGTYARYIPNVGMDRGYPRTIAEDFPDLAPYARSISAAMLAGRDAVILYLDDATCVVYDLAAEKLEGPPRSFAVDPLCGEG